SSSEAPDGWAEADVLLDRTGGFNYGSGIVELQLADGHDVASIGGKRAHWLRCRLADRTRSGATAATFSHPPEIYSITAAAIGALIPVAHSERLEAEDLGESDGTPGQRFTLSFAPVLPPDTDETPEVLDSDTGVWERWERVESFAESGPLDRHFALDLASGEVELGPAIRTADGGWRYHGARPPKGARLRM